MRKAFIKALGEIVAKDKNVMLLTGDLGFSVFEEFAANFPDQYLNCGVAEQNMVGVAAGLALSGKKIFVYSIIPFATMRPFEQIRNDVCMHNLNVKIIGVGGGYSYGHLGTTHHPIEDIAIMKVLPNMKVFVPADPTETEFVVQAVAKDSGPAYIRLGKSKEENLHNAPFDMKIGKANVLREGDTLTIIGAGPILRNAIQAADILDKSNISCRVVSLITVKPLDKEQVIKSAKIGPVVTIEEHSVIGGIGDSVAAVLAEENLNNGFKKMGVEDRFMTIVGDQDYLRAENKLSPEQLAASISDFYKKRLQ